jgi:YhcN/YlaJ family sporulation lipoprotein
MRVMSTFFVLLLILSGCGVQNNAKDNGKQNLVHVKNSTIQEVDRNTGQEISRHLVDLATGVAKVKDATAVVIGNYAIVGIDVDSNIERSEVGSIKYSVAESLKNDPHGARAVVIADPDLNARIKEIAKDIKNGKPISGIMNELSDITGRLIPEIPADIIEPKPKNATEEPKKGLNDSEQRQLEKEQQDQSKHKKD